MNKLSNWIYKISSGWVTLICLVIFLLFTALVLPSQSDRADAYSGDVGSPDTSLYYSADALYQFAEVYGPQGRGDYIRARVTFDVIWPIVYLVFLTTAISWAFKSAGKQGGFWKRLNLVPVFGLIFDYLENGATSIVMWRYPDVTPLLPQLAGVITAFKWVFVGGSFGVLIFGLALAIWRWARIKIQQ